MGRTLILGGTGWLGREIARQALDEGAEVTCAARGTSGTVPDGARFVPMDRMEPNAYDRLDGEWDEVVELSYQPELVLPALNALADRTSHWTLISSVSAYSRNDEPGADESADLVEPTDLSDYGHAKVAAERASASCLDDRLLIVRPGLIVGPGDPTDRFGYWPARLARGGQVLTAPSEGRYVQVIEIDDLAGFVVRAVNNGQTGVVNAIGDSLPFDEFLTLVVTVTAFDGEFVVVDDDWLLAHEVNYWAGPRSIPLWLPPADASFALRSNALFKQMGGTLGAIDTAIARVLADEHERGLDRVRRSGLDTDDESDLVRLAIQAS